MTPDVLQVVGIMKTATDVAIPAMRVPRFQGQYLAYVALEELDGISHMVDTLGYASGYTAKRQMPLLSLKSISRTLPGTIKKAISSIAKDS